MVSTRHSRLLAIASSFALAATVLLSDASPAAAAPIANAGGPYAIAEGQVLTLNGSSSTGSTSFAWDLDNDGQFNDAFGASPTLMWETLIGLGLDDDGSYTIGLRTGDGTSSSDDVLFAGLTISNTPPTISIDGSAYASVGGIYQANLSINDPGDDTTVSWIINWGDSTIETMFGSPGPINHSYAMAGQYDITVTSQDEDGSWTESDLIVPSSGVSKHLGRYSGNTGSFITDLSGIENVDQLDGVEPGPDGLLYVSSFVNASIARYDPTTNAFVDFFVSSGAGGLSGPTGLAFGPDGDLYVSDWTDNEILRFDGSTGAFAGTFVTAGSNALTAPNGLIFGPDGHLYVTAGGGAIEVQKYDGSTGASLGGFADTPGNSPTEDLEFGPDGHLYVAFSSLDRVRKFDQTTGTFLGDFVPSGSGGLNSPQGLAFGPDGNLYVSSGLSNSIKEYDGASGIYQGDFVGSGSGGLTDPRYLAFIPDKVVTVLDGLAVNSTGDASDANAGNGVCDTGSTNSQGAPECTLRAAIQEANGLAGFDTIQFAIPTSEPGYSASPEAFTIQPASLLPEISTAIYLDGSSQPEFVSNRRPVIEIDGQNVSSGELNGLWITGGGTTVRSLVINNFGDDAIDLEFGNGNTIVGNYVGTDVTGTSPQANDWGLNIKTANNTIGGPSEADRNILSGNLNEGLYIKNATATGNVVQGNYIGTNATGTGALPNGSDGVIIFSNASSTTFGGSGAGEGNLVSGNAGNGITMDSEGSDNNAFIGNLIGVTATGTAMIPNGADGLNITSGADNTSFIGNLVAHPNGDGIEIDGPSTGSTIQGNTFGTDLAGVADWSGFHAAVNLRGGTSDSLVGGDLVGQGNLFANAGSDSANPNSVTIWADAGSGNSILGNSSSGSRGIGIDLGPAGTTANDVGDGDSGANDLLNHPDLLTATSDGTTVTVTFNLDVPANADQYRVEFFSNASGANIAGNWEGDSFRASLTTGPGTSLNHTFAGTTGEVFTATATQIDSAASSGFSSTSEFSAASTATGTYAIAGTVFEDIVGDGLNDGGIGGLNNPASNGVAVHLLDGTSTPVASTTSDASGAYSFSGLSNDSYTVWVDSKTVPSSQDPAASASDIWAVQTYGSIGAVCADGAGGTTSRLTAGPCYSGSTGLLSDSSTNRLHRSTFTVAGTNVTSVDFGFSFNVVVNTRGGDGTDDDGLTNRTVQGSLRQFIQNANAIAGANSMRFVPTTPTNDTDWWEILVSTGLPAVTDTDTTIDGTAYELADGTTVRDTNGGFLGSNAVGGLTVGVDDVALPQVAAPELEIQGSGTTANGLEIRADGITIRNIAIYGFGDTSVSWVDGDIVVPLGYSVGGLLIEENVIGTSAGSFTDPGAARGGGSGVAIEDLAGAQSVIRNNLIGFLEESGVSGSEITNMLMSGNEVLDIGLGPGTDYDGLGAEWLSTSTIFDGNLIDGAPGNGISLWSTSGGHTITNNTIRNVGAGGDESGGIGLWGNGSTVERNVITSSGGPGIIVVGDNPGDWPEAVNNRLSRNQFGANGGTAIDLVEGVDDDVPHYLGDGITLTPGTLADSGNIGLDSPAIAIATGSVASGTACANCEVEVYRSIAGAGDTSGGTDYGEGVQYLGTAMADGAGSWALTGLSGLNDGDFLTAIAIDPTNNTSEFGANQLLALALTVNSTGDASDTSAGDGVCDTSASNSQGAAECTLRAAIEESNALLDSDTIRFAMPSTESGHSGGVWTLTPSSALPDLDSTVVIDATTQPGWVTTPVVELDGTSAGAGANGLIVRADNSEVRGLAINRFGANGILVDTPASGTLIAGNHIGSDPSGLLSRGNGQRGIDLTLGSGPTAIGGTTIVDRNLISGNVDSGVIVWDANNNTIIGNYIGVNINGSSPLGNGGDGISIGGTSSNNVIGQAGAGNIVSGNLDDGLELADSISGTIIQANTFGLGADGTTVVANTRHGIVLYDGVNNTQIGAAAAGEGNLISGNGQEGIHVNANLNTATGDNTIQGNLIGTDSTGALNRGNGSYGISVRDLATTTIIGGSAPGAGNVISGNGSHGLHLVWANDTTIVGNTIGLALDQSTIVANGSNGVNIEFGDTTTIGGSAPGAGNIVSGNNGFGIRNAGPDSTILGNYIGTDGTGLLDRGNATIGIHQSGQRPIIGGPGANEGNVISGNGSDGIQISVSAQIDGVIQGNLIGVGADSATTIGNGGRGIAIFNASGILTGGATANEGNLIANNSGAGVATNSTATSISVLGNSIHSNNGIGLDLGLDGVTPNDPGDADSGSNGLLNFPRLISSEESGGTITVSFELDVPAGDYRIEFFANPSGADPSGFGEGEVHVHSTQILAHPGGAIAYSDSFSGSAGDVLTATNTTKVGGLFGSTSEFSGSQVTTVDGGNTFDSSHRRTDLRATGGMTLTSPGSGIAANGFDLAGGTEGLEGPATDLVSNELTISSWVRPSSLGTNPRVVSKAANPSPGTAIYELLIDDSTSEAVARFRIGGSNIEVRGGSIVLGTWTQLAVTWDGSTIRLYVDGTEVDAAGASGVLATDLSVPLVVGNLASADRGFDGEIDQVEVHHAARSAEWLSTNHANLTSPNTFVSMGSKQTGVPQPWSVSSAAARGGSGGLQAPTTSAGADAWVTALGINEPGIEFESWWWISDPAVVDVASGSRTGQSPTDQNEAAQGSSGLDLATLIAGTRTQDAAVPATLPGAVWTKVVLRTDENGLSSLWVDGLQIIGPTAHSGGQTSGSVGFRVGQLPVGETWYVDDVRLRRLVSDEPTTTLGMLDRN